jgi:hypothetical protein
MSLPDEEFDVLGEDEVALLTRWFERMHENRMNTRTCFHCGKPGHFIADYPEKVENKDGNKHKSKTVASTDQGATTRTSTRTGDDRGRMRAKARPERWLERVT